MLTIKFTLSSNAFKICIPQHGSCFLLYSRHCPDCTEHAVTAAVCNYSCNVQAAYANESIYDDTASTSIVISVCVPELQISEIPEFSLKELVLRPTSDIKL